MDRAWSDNHKQSIIRTMEDSVNGLTRFPNCIRRFGCDRELVEQVYRGHQFLDVSYPQIVCFTFHRRTVTQIGLSYLYRLKWFRRRAQSNSTSAGHRRVKTSKRGQSSANLSGRMRRAVFALADLESMPQRARRSRSFQRPLTGRRIPG